jgi:hypothetical protein
MIIYFDMDGVLSDFDAAVLDICEKPMTAFDQDDHKIFWNEIVRTHQFFAKLDPIPEGCDLMTMLSQLPGVDMRILSSTGGGKLHYEIMRQKCQWIEEYEIPKANVTFVRDSKVKVRYAQEGHWLIDDFQKNCDQWNGAGGHALQFKRDDIDAMMAELSRHARRAVR